MAFYAGTLFFYGISVEESKTLSQSSFGGHYKTTYYDVHGKEVGTSETLFQSPFSGYCKATYYDAHHNQIGTSETGAIGSQFASSGFYKTTYYDAHHNQVGTSETGKTGSQFAFYFKTTYYDGHHNQVGTSETGEIGSQFASSGLYKTTYKFPTLTSINDDTVSSDQSSFRGKNPHLVDPPLSPLKPSLQEANYYSFYKPPQSQIMSTNSNCFSTSCSDVNDKWNSLASPKKAVIGGSATGLVSGIVAGVASAISGSLNAIAIGASTGVIACCVTTSVCCCVCRSNICQCDKNNEAYLPIYRG